MLKYIKDWKLWVTCAVIVFVLVMCGVLDAKDKEAFWIDKDVTVLVFAGDPYSARVQPIKLTTFERQQITLFHKDSGPGIYAFFVKGLIIYGKTGKRAKAKIDGYFLAKRSQVSESYRLEQKAKKHQIKKQDTPVKKFNKPEEKKEEKNEPPFSIW